MPKYVRPKPDLQAALLHPDTGVLMVPDPSEPILENDPLVRKHRWAFETDEEQAERLAVQRSGVVTEMPIERATARPGEKRATKRS